MTNWDARQEVITKAAEAMIEYFGRERARARALDQAESLLRYTCQHCEDKGRVNIGTYLEHPCNVCTGRRWSSGKTSDYLADVCKRVLELTGG